VSAAPVQHELWDGLELGLHRIIGGKQKKAPATWTSVTAKTTLVRRRKIKLRGQSTPADAREINPARKKAESYDAGYH